MFLLCARFGLQRKIFLRFTLLVGLALVASGSFSVLIARNAIRQSTVDDLLFLSQERSQAISHIIDAHRSSTLLLAKDRAISHFASKIDQGSATASDAALLRTHLLQQAGVVEGLQDALLLDTTGVVHLATDARREEHDLSHLSHIAYGSHGTYIGPLHVAEGRRSYAIASPIRGNDGALLGILLAEFSLAQVYDAVTSASALGTSGEYLLLEPTSHGETCFNPKWNVFSVRGALPALPGDQAGSWRTIQQLSAAVMQRMGLVAFSAETYEQALSVDIQEHSSLCALAARGTEGILTTQDENARAVLAAHHYLPSVGIGIIAKVDEAEIFQPVRLLITVLVGTTCILLLLVVFISVRLSHDVVDPILRLRDSLQHLNRGHFTHTRSVYTGDELEVLDKEAEHLAHRLHEAYSSLEEKVKERTHKLQEQSSQDEALLESIGEGFLAIDMTGRVITCNRAAEEILAWNRDQIVGGHFSSVLNIRAHGGELLPPNAHFVQRVIEEKRPIHTLPTDAYECERKSGDLFPIAITVTPFQVGEDMRGIVVTFRDVSEEKRIDRMKSEFISLASHQLRTPLTAIGWYTELLQNESAGLNQEQRDYITQIIDSHRRMANLVNALLNVSRIELGRLNVEPTKTNIKHVVESTIGELRPQIEQKQLQYKQIIPDDTTAEVDPGLLQVVIENLVSNAVKYTPDGGTIKVSMTEDDRNLHFEVSDTGMGIPRHQQEKIFEKLFRADNVQKTDTDGTGIGLYITKSVVEAWGGVLNFQSEEGKGTTFRFTTPRIMQRIEGKNGTGKPLEA